MHEAGYRRRRAQGSSERVVLHLTVVFRNLLLHCHYLHLHVLISEQIKMESLVLTL